MNSIRIKNIKFNEIKITIPDKDRRTKHKQI